MIATVIKAHNMPVLCGGLCAAGSQGGAQRGRLEDKGRLTRTRPSAEGSSPWTNAGINQHPLFCFLNLLDSEMQKNAPICQLDKLREELALFSCPSAEKIAAHDAMKPPVTQILSGLWSLQSFTPYARLVASHRQAMPFPM